MISLDAEVAGKYLAECCERLANMERDFLTIEEETLGFDPETADRLVREAHWIAGGAGFFDLEKVHTVAGQVETALAHFRSSRMFPTAIEVHLLRRATAKLNQLVQNAGASNQTDVTEIPAILADLRGLLPAGGDCNSGAAGGAARPLRILLVEDDYASRFLLQTFLSTYGRCDSAVNGLEGVRAFQSALESREGYDLVCMDIMMPVMHGRDAVAQVRALEKARGIPSAAAAKIIMTTAVDEIREVSLCFQEFCDAYLRKPLDLAKLLGLMRSYGLLP